MKISITLGVDDTTNKRSVSETVTVDYPDYPVNPESEQAGIQLRDDVTSITDSYLTRVTDALVHKWQEPPAEKKQVEKQDKPIKLAKVAKPIKVIKSTDEPPVV